MFFAALSWRFGRLADGGRLKLRRGRFWTLARWGGLVTLGVAFYVASEFGQRVVLQLVSAVGALLMAVGAARVVDRGKAGLDGMVAGGSVEASPK